MLYLLHEAPPEEQNFAMIMEMLASAQVKEDDEDYESPLDILFERLEMRDPENIAVKQYHIYKQAAGKTAKSTLFYGIVALALGGCILYRGSFVDFLFITITFVTGLVLIEGAIFNAIAWIWSPEVVLRIQEGFSLLRICILIIIKIVEISVALLLGTLIKRITIKMKKTRLALIGSVFAFFSALYLLNISNVFYNLHLDRIQTFLMIACVFTLYFAYLCFRLKSLQKEKEFTSRQNDLLEKNYQMVQASYEANAKLYHDMRNHFAILQNYLADGKVAEAQNYLEVLSGSKALQNVEHWTGIEAVDYVLSQKISIAEKQQIKVAINVEYPKDCKIEPVDLCTILTNLLDNAIEGAVKSPEYTRRKISITIRRIHQFILIRISNSAIEPPVLRNGRLITTKRNREYHGWGMKSVRSAAEKYNGTVEYSYTDLMFTVSVMLFYS